MDKTKEKPKTKNTRYLQVLIDSELRDKAHRKAQENDLTLSQVVRKMLSDWVEEKQGKLIF